MALISHIMWFTIRITRHNVIMHSNMKMNLGYPREFGMHIYYANVAQKNAHIFLMANITLWLRFFGGNIAYKNPDRSWYGEFNVVVDTCIVMILLQ